MAPAAYPVAALIGATVTAFAAAGAIAWLLGKRGFPLADEDGRFGAIDGLRGYLALSVLAHHFIVWTQVVLPTGGWRAPEIALFDQFGSGAVSLFFMASGLVFYPRILAGFRRTPWRSVLVGRAFRILPLLAVSIGVVATVAMARTGRWIDRNDVVPLIAWITTWSQPGLAGDPDAGRINAYVLWSLKCEWFFYLLVLPLSAVLRDVTRGRVPSILIPAALLLVAAADRIVHVPLARYLPLFVAGMLAYEAAARPAVAARLGSPAVSAAATILLVLAALVFASPLSPGLPATALFFASVACGNDVFGLLKTRGARILGEISFSVYLLHGIVLSLIFTEGRGFIEVIPPTLTPMLLPAIAVVLVPVAGLTHLGIERPAMRLGRRIARRWSGARAPAGSLKAEIAP